MDISDIVNERKNQIKGKAEQFSVNILQQSPLNEFEGIKFEIELKTSEGNDDDDTIFFIADSSPDGVNQVSIKCEIKIEDIGANIRGTIHFKRDKLRALLVDTVILNLEETDRLSMNMKMQSIAKY